MKKYTNVISLGFFCSVALEMQHLNLRKSSSPFDWLITSSMEKVVELVENSFHDFLEFEYLAQFTSNPAYYQNTSTGISFFHDFSAYAPLKKQYTSVKEKYDRRIKRFYETIKQPTLFIRYISNQEDIDYIIANQTNILHLLRKFNEKNDIIYIANTTLKPDVEYKNLEIYYVVKDDGDSVARSFLNQLPDLTQKMIDNCEEALDKKTKRSKKHKHRDLCTLIRRKLHWYYRHDKVI